MPEAETAKAVQLLDLMLEFFADDGHWTRGCYDDGNGGHCLVGALLHLSRKHRLPTAPAIALLQDAMPRPGLPLVHFNDTRCGSLAELRSVILKARRLAHDDAERERAAAAVKTWLLAQIEQQRAATAAADIGESPPERASLPTPCRVARVAAAKGAARHPDHGGRLQIAAMWRAAFLSLALTLFAVPAPAQQMSAPVRVIDGDTLEMGGVRIRLWGIDAPEMQQTCEGKDGQHLRMRAGQRRRHAGADPRPHRRLRPARPRPIWPHRRGVPDREPATSAPPSCGAAGRSTGPATATAGIGATSRRRAPRSRESGPDASSFRGNGAGDHR